MEYVLSLVSNPAGPHLEPADAERASAALAAHGAPVGTADWLAADIACDIGFAGLPPDRAEATVREALTGRPIDLLAQPALGRRKRLLLADMDSTIIDVECIDELADFVGLKAQVARVTERAMQGEIDFASALRERAALLRGLDATVLETAYRERVRLNPGARSLVATMRRHGARTALVSGGFTYFTARVREAAGFHEDQANVLEIADGRLTGKVRPPILDSGAKLAALRRLAAECGLGPEETMAVGDGANDLPMVRAAGLGVAYRAKPVLAQAARARIDHGDLTALLYFQGYRAEDFGD